MESIDAVSFVKEQKQVIFDELDNLTDLSELCKKQKIDDMFLKADQVKKYVHLHLAAMISYEIRVCNNIIKEIDARISKERDVLNNKQFKFSFNLNRANVKNVNKLINGSNKETQDQIDSRHSLEGKWTGLKGLCNEERVLTSTDVDHKELNLESLTRCAVRVEGAASVLRLINLQYCRVYSGPVSSSVFISNCHNCELHLAGQQLRIHDTTNCDIYQHVTSRSIIEGCSKLRFGCFTWKYDHIEQDFDKAKLDMSVNNWKEVDDFDCLSNPSPNWSLLNQDAIS